MSREFVLRSACGGLRTGKLRAERRAGELIPEQIRKPEQGRPEKASHDVRLSDLGVSEMQSSRWQDIASIPEEIFEEHKALKHKTN